MVDAYHFRGGTRGRAGWRRAFGRVARKVRRLIAGYGGFLAVAGLAVGAVLFQSGQLHPSVAVRGGTEHFAATAIDGDSLRAAGKNIRLAGIDAPELHQTCRDELGRTWACGHHAHVFLRGLVSRGALTCTSSSTDRYGRALATCSAGDVADIGEAMVRAGYAVRFMGMRYWLAEAEARAEKRGIWRGTFDRPQAWRREHPRS